MFQLALFGYEMITANLTARWLIYHLISNARSWNNSYFFLFFSISCLGHVCEFRKHLLFPYFIFGVLDIVSR